MMWNEGTMGVGSGDRYDDNCFWFFSFRSISPYFEHVSLMFYLTIHCDVQSIYTGGVVKV